MEDLTDMLQSYKYKFPESKITEILSYECQKSIPIISTKGYKILPHYQYSTWKDIKDCLKYLEKKARKLNALSLAHKIIFLSNY